MRRDRSAVIERIVRGEGPPLLLVFGDSLRVEQVCKALIDRLIPESDRAFNLERFDGRTNPWEEIVGSLRIAPFFPGRKVVWVENAPYFLSREHKGELSERALELWAEGKRDEAGRLLLDLLAVDGWTQQQWEELQGPAPLYGVAGIEDHAEREEIAAIWAHCRSRGFGIRPRRESEGTGIVELCDGAMPPWSFLLLTAIQVDRRTRLYKKLEEAGAVLFVDLDRDRGRVKRESLLDHINRWASASGKTLEGPAREMILQRAGEALRPLAHELEKLLIYVGEERVIRAKDVAASFSDLGEGWIFDLTQAIGDRNAPAALSQLARLIARGEPPLRLLGTIATEIRRLVTARQLIEGELRGRWRPRMSYDQFQRTVLGGEGPLFGRNAYADYKTLQRAEQFSLAALRSLLAAVHEADFRLKSSGQPARLVLERLILELCLGRGVSCSSARVVRA